MTSKDAMDPSCIQQFQNCKLLRDHEIVVDDLWVRNGKILNPEKLFFDEQAYADIQIDCKGALICPGFIEVQINGAFGVDFSLPSDKYEDGLSKVAKGLLAHGVTSFIPTIVTSSPTDYAQILPRIKRAEGSSNGAGILGIHVEGPFISKEKKGAHNEPDIVDCPNGMADIEKMYGSLDSISMITIAPEIDGALPVIKGCVEKGVCVSLGHSMANLQQGEAAVAAGANFITHLFNAMLPFHHRDPHLVGLLASDKIPAGHTVFYGMIADGVHTHPAALRIAHRTHSQGIVLVTDAVPAMGLPPGLHHLGRQDVNVTENGAYIDGTDTLCGSTATLNRCVKYFYNATECSQVEALESATLHPAQALGITGHKGTLAYNTDADFVLLNDDLDLQATFIAGELVWEKEMGAKRHYKYILKPSKS